MGKQPQASLFEEMPAEAESSPAVFRTASHEFEARTTHTSGSSGSFVMAKIHRAYAP
jgi:hypothetical protein